MALQPVLRQAIELQQAGRLNEAEAMYRQAVAALPDSAEAHINLAAVLFQLGRLEESIAESQLGLSLWPCSFEAYNTLGNALNMLGRPAEALAAYNQALALRSDNPVVHYNAAAALRSLSQRGQAETALRRALQLKGDFAEAMMRLGLILTETGRLEEAVRILRRALQLQPDVAEALNTLGIALKDLGLIDEALEPLQRAIALHPHFASAHNTIGNVLLRIGRVEQAVEAYRRAVQLDPHNATAHSNLIFAMNFDSRYDSAAILREGRQWNERHGKPNSQPMHHTNDRDPDRRLRVGYISADFRQHVLAWNLLPLLQHHDRKRVEIFCYSSDAVEDDMTARVRSFSHQWRDASGLSDAQLAEQIRRDRIDLLIDLSVHSGGNRLGAFALAPAPVQITYLGYCGTTGLDAMQYRFSDPHLDPMDGDLMCYSEKTIRLPGTYWCYAPAREAPDVNSPPLQQLGHVTFGCPNQFAKVSPAAIQLWCKILRQLPGSRMIVHAQPGKYLAGVGQLFASHGVLPQRIEFVPGQLWEPYMRTYHRIDIALDPFPYNGGITTCDALWMGVPVVSLSGRTPVGRAGRSILSNVGLPELIAGDPQEYVRMAVALAGDAAKLAELRSSLRQRMKSSPLMDAPRFAGNVEAAYRQAWRRWCAGASV